MHVIAHHAAFDRPFLEKRLPAFITKHWACSRIDIDWKSEGISSSALEFVAYVLGFFHDGHRAANDCRATLHALAQSLPGTGKFALQALWKRRECRLGDCRHGTHPLRRRMFSKPRLYVEPRRGSIIGVAATSRQEFGAAMSRTQSADMRLQKE